MKSICIGTHRRNHDCRCQWVTVLGTTYRVNKCWMMVGRQEVPTGTLPQFGQLCDIIIHGAEPHILFVFMVSPTLSYNPHVGAYVVEPLPNVLATSNFYCVYRSSLHCHHTFNAVQSRVGHCLYVKSKYDLTVYCNYE